MKFHLNHDPANKTLTIPRAALQLSGLAETSDLTIHTENGCVLLLPEKLSVAQTLKTFQLLTAINAELLFRLGKGVFSGCPAAVYAGGGRHRPGGRRF